MNFRWWDWLDLVGIRLGIDVEAEVDNIRRIRAVKKRRERL